MAKWKMPKWMERYRACICNTGGNCIEDMVNGNADPRVNLPLSTLQACVKSQVTMLELLHEQKLLGEPQAEAVIRLIREKHSPRTWPSETTSAHLDSEEVKDYGEALALLESKPRDKPAIEDRTRSLRKLAQWDAPEDIVEACAQQFHVDLWKDQPFRPEVWIEKDALVGVIEGVCEELDVPYFSCRGYTSQSEMWGAGMRLLSHIKEQRQKPVIFHFGDHDPSGKDMTRDIIDRLQLFMGGVEVQRLALNMDQVEHYKPPPNPAKTTDSRYAAYIVDFGHESWELDALEPAVIAGLIRRAVETYQNKKLWKQRLAERKKGRSLLAAVAEQWKDVMERVEGL